MASTDTRTEQDRRAALIEARRRHWHRTRRMTGVMLAVWLLATLVPLFYARELAQLTLFGWPLSFYLAAQGASLVYLAIVGTYYWRMGRIDAQFRRELA